MADKRWSVRFGDAPHSPRPQSPKNEQERLQRALALLEELYLADFMPDEFHAEYLALKH